MTSLLMREPADRQRVQRLHDLAVSLGAHCEDCEKGSLTRGERLQRANPNHYGPGPKGGQFAPKDAGGGTASGNAAPPKPVQVAANDTGVRSDAGGTQISQANTEVPLGVATARAVLAREVASGRMSQADADQLLAGIETSDAQAIARVNTALRIRSGIPENWTAEPAGRAGSGQGGVLYRNPDDRYDNVRIMPGNPRSSNLAQREPYVVDQKDDRFLTRDGDRVEANEDETTHIPLDDYHFDKR